MKNFHLTTVLNYVCGSKVQSSGHHTTKTFSGLKCLKLKNIAVQFAVLTARKAERKTGSFLKMLAVG